MSSSGATWGDRSLSATRVCSAFTRPSLRQAGAPGSTWAARVLSVTERGLGGRGAVAFVTMAAVGRRTDPRSAEIEAEAPELLRVALPVLGDLDVEVEVDLGPEQAFDAAAGLRADRLESAPAAADDDRLLAGTFDEERSEERRVGKGRRPRGV